MTRPIAPALLAAFRAPDVLSGEILLLIARDGTIASFTTLDVPTVVDLGPGPATFSEGMTLAAITLVTGLDASFTEAHGALGGQMARDAVLGGKWDNAQAWLATVSPEVDGFAPWLYGRVTEARVEGSSWVAEIRNEADRFNQVIGEQVGPLCRADFGDARCTKVVPPVAATIIAVTSPMRFTVSFEGSYADDHFNLGTLVLTDGELAGGAPMDIFDWTADGGVTLLEPLVAAPKVGDMLSLRVGCAKTRAACMAYGNILNMRAEPELPGSDQVLRYPDGSA